MPKHPPFSQVHDGVPVWELDVDDPQDFEACPAELSLRRLRLPQGEVLALALRLFDLALKPQLHHLAGPLARPEVAAWAQALRQSRRLRLVLRRAGWATEAQRDIAAPPLALAPLEAPPQPGPDPEGAIRSYLDRYRQDLPKLGQPEAVWDALAAPPKTAQAPKPPWGWIALGLLAAGAAAWFLP